MQHLHNVVDDSQLLGRDVEPVVEGERKFHPYLLALYLKQICKWLQEYLKEQEYGLHI